MSNKSPIIRKPPQDAWYRKSFKPLMVNDKPKKEHWYEKEPYKKANKKA